MKTEEAKEYDLKLRIKKIQSKLSIENRGIDECIILDLHQETQQLKEELSKSKKQATENGKFICKQMNEIKALKQEKEADRKRIEELEEKLRLSEEYLNEGVKDVQVLTTESDQLKEKNRGLNQSNKKLLEGFVSWFNQYDKTQGILNERVDEYIKLLTKKQ